MMKETQTTEPVKATEPVATLDVEAIYRASERLKGIVTPVAERWIVQDGLAWYVYNG